MGGRAPRIAEGGSKGEGDVLGFWERNPMGGTVSPFNIFRQFSNFVNHLIPAGHHLWEGKS